jgi:hypothetical protein
MNEGDYQDVLNMGESIIRKCILRKHDRVIWIGLIWLRKGISGDRLCGLVGRVPGYRSGGPGSIPALPDFLRSSDSGTESTQPREYN